MALTPPAYCSDLDYPFDMLRLQMSSLASAGVGSPTDLQVSPSTGLQVAISAGRAWVQQTVASEGSAYNGLYFMINDAPASPYNNVSAPIAYPRIDLVVLRVYDAIEQGLAGQSFARFEWVEGTETSGATLINLEGAPALPSNSLLLADVLQTVGENSIPSSNILNVAPSSTPSQLKNRIQVGSNSNISMKSGVLYESLGGTSTFSLPAASMGSVVGVTQGGGSGVITVQTSDGAFIHGAGISGTSTSFQLGTTYASVLLFSDGTQWFIVSGQQNTGWQVLALAGGTGSFQTPTGFDTAAARLTGDRIELKGAIQNAGPAGSGGTSVALAQVPAAMKPSVQRGLALQYGHMNGSTWVAGYSSNTSATALPSGALIETDGYIYLPAHGLYGGDIALLDGCSYPLN